MHHILIFFTHASTYISTRWAPSSRRIRRLSTSSLLYPDPRQNFGSTSPLLSRYTSRQKAERDVHPENTGEALPKSCLESM